MRTEGNPCGVTMCCRKAWASSAAEGSCHTYEVTHFSETVYHHQDGVVPQTRRHIYDKIHGQRVPRSRRDRDRL